MTVSGENGELTFGGTVTFENKSEFILNSSGSKISGSFDFTNNNIMNAQETVNFDSKVSKWNNSQIKVTEGATLQFTDNQWQTQGTLTKTGGSMSLEKVVWSLSADTSYSSDTAVKTQTLSLNNHLLTLGTEGSDITVTDNMTFDNSSEHISTGLADLNLEGSLILKEGEITSTGGIVFLGTGGKQSGGKLDVTDSTLKLGDDFTKTEGTLTVNENGTTLELTNNVTLTSNTALSLKELSLNDNTLSLGSDTTDLTVRDPIILNHTNEKILANAADLTLAGLLSVENGEINSDNASLKFNGGIKQTGGQLNLNNSQLKLVGDISKTGGTLQTSTTEVTISADMKITSNSELSVKSLDLGGYSLELGSETSDLTISDGLSLEKENIYLNTVDADLTVDGEVNLAKGKLDSTAGTLLFRNGTVQSGSFEFNLGASSLSLGNYYTKTGGSLDSSSATLTLNDNTTITSDSSLDFDKLELNKLTLTLGDADTDLQISSAVTMDNSTEFIITNEADLTLLAALNISDGGVTSTAGTLSFLGGGKLTDNGTIDFSGSTWVLGSDFEKSSGTLTISQTDIKLAGSSTLTSDGALSFVKLDLNDYILTLGSSDSDLTVEDAVTINTSTEGILTGEADLILKSALTMSDGRLESTGGSIKFAHDQTSKFSGDACWIKQI